MNRPDEQDFQRIAPSARREDLILPEPAWRTLDAIVAQGRLCPSPGGPGVAALFAGPSGTGKTLAAEVIASELRLDLLRIDLGAVFAKYVGETEKNLRRIFDSVEATGAVLLFDEADALFGKRGTVQDSHDRYANIAAAYLLEKMETHRGLVIVTTKGRDNLDPAFLRRLRFVVEFPLRNSCEA